MRSRPKRSSVRTLSLIGLGHWIAAHRGHCLLFSRGTWRETDGQFVVDWANGGYCVGVTAVATLQALASLFQIHRLGRHLHRGTDSSFLAALCDVCGGVVVCLASLAAALAVTLGFGTWCADITQRFEECSYAQDEDIDQADGVDTAGFYVLLGTAQFGAWAAWSVWVCLAVCAVLKLCRYHQRENVRVSMAKQRRRIVGELSDDQPILE